MADFGTGTSCAGKVQPLCAWVRGRGRDDVHGIAARQLSAQRDRFTIDFAGSNLVANVCMDGIGKVHRGRTTGQRHDLAFWGKDVDGVREQVNLDVLQEFTGVASLALDIKQGLQRLVGTRLDLVQCLFVRLV